MGFDTWDLSYQKALQLILALFGDFTLNPNTFVR